MLCLVQKGVLCEYFQSDVGLMPEETLSPLLFSLYVNDLEINFQKKTVHSRNTESKFIFINVRG